MLAVMFLTFAAVFLLIIALWFFFRVVQQSPSSNLKHRLRRMSGDEEDNHPKEVTRNILRKESAMEQVLHRLPLQGPIGRLLEHSGTSMSPTAFTSLNIGSFVAVFLLMMIFKGNVLFALASGTVAALIPSSYLNFKRTKRRSKFEEQIPDALLMISRSLQSGHSLTGAIELVGQMMPEPAGRLFQMTYEQQKLGMRISDALESMPDRIESLDLRFFVTIVKMNNEIGGGLSETLEKLAETVRARVKIRRQIQVYTAEGKISGYILSGLPFAVFGLIYMLSPDYLEPFFTNESCRFILYGVLAAQAVGFLFIRNIVNIRI
jgi:tight adherence protein B